MIAHAASPPIPPAVVVGLCTHGLAVARALHRGGVAVTALESDFRLPGVHTRVARVVRVPEIGGEELIDALISVRDQLPARPDPVLYLTNDHMVRTVGHHWQLLEGAYRLSWSDCRETVLRLLDKRSLEAHCHEHRLPYPRTGLYPEPYTTEAPTPSPGTEPRFPLIVKPAHPLSGFKVRLVDDRQGLERLAAIHPHSLPFLLQEWIPGDDHRIHFTAFYLDRGRIAADFGGRKIASLPPAMGSTLAAEPLDHDGMRALAERFFAPLRLSGPASLEAKLDDQDRPWIIEPTVGRTDYWLDCCVANGVNLPLVEHRTVAGIVPEPPRRGKGTIWFDSERDPTGYLRLRLGGGETATRPWRPRFAYWDRGDPAPFGYALLRLAARTGHRAWKRLTRSRSTGRPSPHKG